MAETKRSVVLSRADTRRDAAAMNGWQMIEAVGVGALPDDLESVCVVLEDDIDHDQFVAMVSVLAVRGVRAFETSQPTVVQRILDAHAAISAGNIEVLEP